MIFFLSHKRIVSVYFVEQIFKFNAQKERILIRLLISTYDKPNVMETKHGNWPISNYSLLIDENFFFLFFRQKFGIVSFWW